MDLVKLMVIFIQKIQSDHDYIRKVSMVQNDIWGDGQAQIKTDKGYLYAAIINFFDKNSCSSSSFANFLANFQGLKFTKCRYAPLWCRPTKDIYSFFKSPHIAEIFVKFKFIFTDIPIKDFFDYDSYVGKKRICVTYKQHKNDQSKDDISGFNLTHNELEIRMFHIKQMFKEFVNMKLLKINYFIGISKEKKLKKALKTQKKFDLYFFENFEECLINVKDFVKKLKCFEVLKDDDLKLDKKDDFSLRLIPETTISVSELLKCLSKKFYEDYKNLNNDGFFEHEDVNILKFLYNGCCDHLKEKMLENNLMFLLRGKFNIDYFLAKIYNCFKESIKSTKRSMSVLIISSINVNTTLKKLIDLFDIHILELQEKALHDLCESKLYLNHLLKYLEKHIKTSEDYINIENLICDYHNILVFIVKSDSTFKSRFENFSFSKPIFFDENNYKLIDGIEIKFDYKPYLKCLKAFYGKEEFLILEKDVHYFISELNNLYCPFDILKELKIQEIELVSYNGKSMLKFKVYDYINV